MKSQNSLVEKYSSRGWWLPVVTLYYMYIVPSTFNVGFYILQPETALWKRTNTRWIVCTLIIKKFAIDSLRDSSTRTTGARWIFRQDYRQLEISLSFSILFAQRRRCRSVKWSNLLETSKGKERFINGESLVTRENRRQDVTIEKGRMDSVPCNLVKAKNTCKCCFCREWKGTNEVWLRLQRALRH